MVTPTRRPGFITLLTVLIVLGGFFDVVGGILLLIFQNDDAVQDLTDDVGVNVTVLAIITIVFGLIYLAFGRALGNGSGFARFLVALIALIHVVAGVLTAVQHTGDLRWSGILSAVWGALILLILFTPRANAFFRTN